MALSGTLRARTGRRRRGAYDVTPKYRFSAFGSTLTRQTGALQLMADLATPAPPGIELMPLGGGNPARIPEVEAVYRRELAKIAADAGAFGRFAECYSAPEGDRPFRESLARYLTGRLGAAIEADNIALTPGSQAAFFLLFNLLAGRMSDGSRRRILLPLVPEYIGYADLGIDGSLFVADRPRIELLAEDFFKYRVDFEELSLDPSIAAICVSRPTNPTGNVLTDGEMRRLDALARDAGIPFIVDAAYGQPFPGIVFGQAVPFWNDNVVLCLSLSKLGLPALRTGIVVADRALIEALRAMSAVTCLAPPSSGAVLIEGLLDSGELDRLCGDYVRPYYHRRAQQTVAWLRAALNGLDYRIHQPEGAFFLWLWLPQLAVPTLELYARLKARGVVVVPGEHFFPGLHDEDWPHTRQCLRLSYAQSPDAVERGVRIIGEEVRAACHDARR
jgi:valine--pyruvate aminotransferase